MIIKKQYITIILILFLYPLNIVTQESQMSPAAIIKQRHNKKSLHIIPYTTDTKMSTTQLDTKNTKNLPFQISDTLLNQITDYPAWTLIAYAQKLRTENNFTDSLIYLLKAQEKDFHNPYLDYELALTYKTMNNYLLAERYFNKVLSYNPKQFNVLRKNSLYQLSNIYYNQRAFSKYHDTLEHIIIQSNIEPVSKNIVQQYTGILTGTVNFIEKNKTKAIDLFPFLYRLPINYTYQARVKLGIYYTNSGNYNAAVNQLSQAVLMIYTTLITEIRQEKLNYEFVNTQTLLDYAHNQKIYDQYIHDVDFYQVLYYLGLALYGVNPQYKQIQYSREIWDIVNQYSSKKQLQILSKKLINSNQKQIEKYLVSLQENIFFTQ